VVDAHQILVMEQGRIVERGTHAELLARTGAMLDVAPAGKPGTTRRAGEVNDGGWKPSGLRIS
jgi:hypothetical protein